MTPPTTKPKLDDLSAKDRAALLAEARAEVEASAPAVPTDEDAKRRSQAIATLFDSRDHERWCPDPTGQCEVFEARVPPDQRRGIPAHYVGVARCKACGATSVQPDTKSEDGPTAVRRLIDQVIAIEESTA